MKKRQLIKIIKIAMTEVIKKDMRKIIKEEIAMVLGNLVMEGKLNTSDDSNNNTIQTSKKNKKSGRKKISKRRNSQALNEYRNTLNKVYSKDKGLNKLLNETAEGLTEEEISNFGESGNADAPSVLDHKSSIPTSVSKAINKDYSKVFGKEAEKKKRFRP